MPGFPVPLVSVQVFQEMTRQFFSNYPQFWYSECYLAVIIM